jgi:mxaK protein
MKNSITSSMKLKNIILLIGAVIGLIGLFVAGKQYLHINEINSVLSAGKLLKDDAYPLKSKFSAAYYQGENKDYKHAVQTYTQILEEVAKFTTPLNTQQIANIQYNIGNNLLTSGIHRKLNDDGSLNDESKYSFLQARIAYEHAQRTAPDMLAAKFNLSLLNSIIPTNMKSTAKEKSGVELSNLPVGLP